MPPWLFCTIAAVLFLSAIGLLYWGLWGDRSKGRLRCPKCWYGMEGSFVAGALTCPECGHDARQEKRLKKNHRRWWAMVLTVVLLTPHCYAGYIWYGWWRERPVSAMFDRGDAVVVYKWFDNDIWLEWIPESLHRYSDRVVHIEWVADHLSNNSLMQIGNLTHIRLLVLHATDVTDAGLAHLKGLTQLESLGLGSAPVTDDGLVHLQELTQLEILWLDSTRVTDAGLVHLKGLTQLKKLYLRGTQVTDAGVAELQKALPNCKIEH